MKSSDYPPLYTYRTGELVTKENAEYRKGESFARCGLCAYKRGQRCEVVAGYIAPYQVCKFFRAKDGSKMKPGDDDGDEGNKDDGEK